MFRIMQIKIGFPIQFFRVFHSEHPGNCIIGTNKLRIFVFEINPVRNTVHQHLKILFFVFQMFLYHDLVCYFTVHPHNHDHISFPVLYRNLAFSQIFDTPVRFFNLFFNVI